MLFILLLIVLGLVALTSIAGGLVMALGSWLGPEKLGLPAEAQVPVEYLNGSPFSSFLVPGLLLALIVGGLHTAAFAFLLRHHRLAGLFTAAAGYSILVWIFVQMTLIPFSVLQVIYFGAGLAEIGLLLLLLGVGDSVRRTSRARPQHIQAVNGTLGPVERTWRPLGSRHEREESGT